MGVIGLVGWAQWLTDVGILVVFAVVAWLMLRDWSR